MPALREQPFEPVRGGFPDPGELRRLGETLGRVNSLTGPGVSSGGHGDALRAAPGGLAVAVIVGSVNNLFYRWRLLVPDDSGGWRHTAEEYLGGSNTPVSWDGLAYSVNNAPARVGTVVLLRRDESLSSPWFFDPHVDLFGFYARTISLLTLASYQRPYGFGAHPAPTQGVDWVSGFSYQVQYLYVPLQRLPPPAETVNPLVLHCVFGVRDDRPFLNGFGVSESATVVVT